MRDESQGTLQVSFWRKLRIGETAQLCSLINHSLSEGLGRFPAAGFYWSNRPKSCQSFFPSICSGLFRKFRNLHNVGQLTTIIIYYIFIPSNPPKNGDFTGGKRMKKGGTSRPAVSASIFRPAPCKAPLEPSDIRSMWPQLKDTEGYWRHGGNSTHPPDISRVAGCWLQDGTGTLWSFCFLFWDLQI